MATSELSVTEAAAQVGLCRNAIIVAIRAGRLPARKIGSQWVIRRYDLARWYKASDERRKLAKAAIVRMAAAGAPDHEVEP